MDDYPVSWHIFAIARNNQEATREIKRFEDRIKLDLQVTRRERYWKDPSLYNLLLEGTLAADDEKDAVYQMLGCCGRLSTAVRIRPHYGENAEWSIQGSILEQRDFLDLPKLHSVTFVLRHWLSIDSAH